MMWGTKRHVVPAMVGAGVLCALAVASLGASSQQEDKYRLLREALVSPTTAYMALPPQFLCGDGPNTISTSPDGKDALILHRVSAPPQSLEAVFQDEQKRDQEAMRSGATQSVQLLLFSEGDDHAQIVWRGGGSITTGLSVPEPVRWLPGTRMALLQIKTLSADSIKMGMQHRYVILSEAEQGRLREAQPQQSLLLINTATGKSQTVASNIAGEAELITSETDPVAVLMNRQSGTVQRIEASGKMGPILRVKPLEGDAPMPDWDGFLTDGRTLTGTALRPASEGKPGRHVSYQFDTIAGTLIEISKPAAIADDSRQRVAEADVPFIVQREKGTLTRAGVATTVYPLWLEGRDKEVTGRTLIAADSDPTAKPILLQSAIVYQYKGSIYAVPILKSNAPDFLAQRREMQKQETLKRAKQIGLGMMMYSQDYDEVLPPVGSDVSTIVDPYLRNPSVFQNPATGQNGFAALYKSANMSTYQTPATTPLGTLSGPGGTAVIYLDGHVKWDDGTGNP